MLDTATITETSLGLPATLAFRIDGRVSEIEMKMMADRVREAFESHDKIDLVLIFDHFAGMEPGSTLNAPVVKAQAESVWNVRAYVVVGAPGDAARMIETFGRMLPVRAKTFDSQAEAVEYLASLAPLE
jgi:hypothetical protein